MKRLFVLLALFSLFLVPPVTAQEKIVKQEFYKAKVTAITKEGTKNIGGKENAYQLLDLRILDKPLANTLVHVEYGGIFSITEDQKTRVGDTVILTKTTDQKGKPHYSITDRYRLDKILFIALAFVAAVIFFAGKRGVGSIIGMGISLAVIVLFIIPQILNGADPLGVSILGCIVILVTTIYLAHGFSQRTTIAVVATALSLFLTGIFAAIFVKLALLSGLGSEDTYILQQSYTHPINFHGLLLGGILIGALGVLDDVTTTQTAAVYELAETDKKLTVPDLIKKGLRIGKEHIVSVVNTLVLAYAGASIGIFIFLVLATREHIQPLWVIVNSEVITEEIIRTLAGSMGLILAVPLTTVLAAFFSRYSIKIK